jgi:hypothetical protein
MVLRTSTMPPVPRPSNSISSRLAYLRRNLGNTHRVSLVHSRDRANNLITYQPPPSATAALCASAISGLSKPLRDMTSRPRADQMLKSTQPAPRVIAIQLSSSARDHGCNCGGFCQSYEGKASIDSNGEGHGRLSKPQLIDQRGRPFLVHSRRIYRNCQWQRRFVVSLDPTSGSALRG